MGRLIQEQLQGKLYCCKQCHNHLALRDDSNLLSKNFHSRNGKAYLFEMVSNVQQGKKVEREMTTGLHVVRDIRCNQCLSLVGWKYVAAYDEQQKYKVGRFILERSKIITSVDDDYCPYPQHEQPHQHPPHHYSHLRAFACDSDNEDLS